MIDVQYDFMEDFLDLKMARSSYYFLFSSPRLGVVIAGAGARLTTIQLIYY